MAFAHGSKAKVMANGYDLSSYLTSIDITGSADVVDTSTFGRTHKKYIPGLKYATLAAEGLFDGSANSVDQILSAALGQGSSIWTWFPQGDAVGKIGKGFDAIETSYDVTTTVDDAARISAEAQSVVGAENIVSLHDLKAETATGTGSVVDNGKATSNGGAAYLQVDDVSGTSASLTVKIQHSSDNVTYTDLVAFNVVTDAHKAQRVKITGTINRYVKAIWTIAGTNPSFEFQVALYRA